MKGILKKSPKKEGIKENSHKMIRIMHSKMKDKDGLKEGPYKPRLHKLKVELFCIKWNMKLLSNKGVWSPMSISVPYSSVICNCGL